MIELSDELKRLIEQIEELESSELPHALIDQIVPHGAAAVESLIGLLDADHSGARRVAARALGRIGDERAIEPLRRALEDDHALVRRDAILGLGSLGASEAGDDLIPFLASEEEETVTQAIRSIGMLDDTRHAATLLPLLEDERASVRLAASQVLPELPIVEALPVFVRVLDEETDHHRLWNLLIGAAKLVGALDEERLMTAVRELPIALRRRVQKRVRDYDDSNLDPFEGLLARANEAEVAPEELAEYGVDLVTRVRDGFPIHGREREIEEVRAQIGRGEGSRSVLLVGPSGAGKTGVVREVARRASDGLALLQAGTGEVIRGTKYIGEWQTRLLELVDTIKRPRNVVWYVPDIGNLATIGRTAHGDENFADILLPYVERGEIALIGEITPEGYRKSFELNPALRRLFKIIRVEPMTRDETEEILARHAEERSERTRRPFRLTQAARERLLDLAEGYLPGIAFPGKAIRLLGQVIDHLSSDGNPLSREDEEPFTIEPTHVSRALSEETGLPTFVIDDDERLDVDRMTRFFSERVLGQEEAIQAVMDRIILIKAGVTDPTRPLGVFFFVGPTGVGKTELAKALAEFLFGSPDRLLRIDMSEYKDYHAFEKLIGDPKAGDRSAFGHGQLTSRIRQQPFSVVLLDEIEKAHANIFDLFLQVFDDGRLTDARGDTVDFRQTILIMTSNLGSDLRKTSLGFLPSSSREARKKEIRKTMEETFRPEFMGRLDQIVFFEPLSRDVMQTLAQRELGRILMRSGIARRRLIVDLHESVIQLLLEEGFHPLYGARPLKRKVEQLVLLPLARCILEIGPGAVLQIRADGEQVLVDVLKTGETPDETGRERRRTTAVPEREQEDLLAAAEKLETRVRKLADRCEDEALAARKQELIEETCSVTFWDDTKEARQIMTEINDLGRILDSVARLEKRASDLSGFVQSLGESRRPTADRNRALDWRADLRSELEMTEYMVHCREPRERADAYLVVSSLGEASDEDLIRIHRMYGEWARSHGFEHRVLLERAEKGRGLTSLVSEIEGVCVSGLLMEEEGLHVLLDEKSSKQNRQERYVKVEIIPNLPDPPNALNPDETVIECRPIKKTAAMVAEARLRSRVRALHKGSGVQFIGHSVLPAQEAEAELLRLLGARVLHADHQRRSPDEVVRTYCFSPTRWVRDDRAGEKRGDLAAVLDGGIDRYIRQRLNLEEA